jgi:hypothetical protein
VNPAAAPSPAAIPPSPAAQGAATSDQSIYLWPTYVPPGMMPSPDESRVSGDAEVGNAGLGFYIITLNDGAKKLVIGGGGIDAPLPLAGEQRKVTLGGRGATLIASGEQRQLVFDVPQGKLFIYGDGLSEEELLKVGESLRPLDIAALRALAGAR